MEIIPINMAEAIIEPFWDRQLSGLKQWNIDPETRVVNGGDIEGENWWEQQSESTYVYGDGYTVIPRVEHGLKVYQNWCSCVFEWARKPKSGPALKMSRDFNISCVNYHKLMVSVVLPEDSQLVIQVSTDKGIINQTFTKLSSSSKEYLLELHQAEYINTITLEIYAQEEGIARGWFNWIGFQNTKLLKNYLEKWKRFDKEWEPYIKPEDYEPNFKSQYGFLFNESELESMRIEHEECLKKYGGSPFVVAGKEAEKNVPEQLINEYVNFWTDTRFCRDRDNDKCVINYLPYGYGVRAAVAGLLTNDKELLRLGARYAMSIAMCEHWEDGMVCRLPGSNFEHKAFVQSLCTYEVSLVLDLAGDMFTDIGRQFLLRRISEEGIANINWRIWKYAEKHEEIFKMNQLAWFTPGRMLGYLTLEKFWSRVSPYTNIAYEDLVESLNQCILPDGGYVEGPLYFGTVARNGGLSLYYYAKQRGVDFEAIVPESIKKTADFAEALISTDDNMDVILICDCAQHNLDHDYLAVMSVLLPESQWVTMFNKSLQRSNGMTESIMAFKLKNQIPKLAPPMRSFVYLPNMGIMSSLRKIDGELVKLLILGNEANAGHTHEDKGSFVLEFAGQTFAMDPGSDDYSSPITSLLSNCDRHNMLVPYGVSERPCPTRPIPYDVKPQGNGDDLSFHAKIDATYGWEDYYKKWTREWESPQPDKLIIRDEYELINGDGVEFYWNTTLDIEICGNSAFIEGKRGSVTIKAPKDCTLRVDNLSLANGRIQNRLSIIKKAVSGLLEVEVEMSIKD